MQGKCSQRYYKTLFEFFESECGIEKNDEGVYIETRKVRYVYHDVLFRRYSNEESLKYTARRLDIFWTHFNNLSCIVFAFVAAFFIAITFDGFQGSFNILKSLLITPFVTYLICGYKLAVRDLRDSTEFEKIFLTHLRTLSPDELIQ